MVSRSVFFFNFQFFFDHCWSSIKVDMIKNSCCFLFDYHCFCFLCDNYELLCIKSLSLCLSRRLPMLFFQLLYTNFTLWKSFVRATQVATQKNLRSSDVGRWKTIFLLPDLFFFSYINLPSNFVTHVKRVCRCLCLDLKHTRIRLPRN